MNSRSPKIPAKRPSASTAGSAGRPASTPRRAPGPISASALSGSISRRVSLAMESGMVSSSERDVADCDVGGGQGYREDRHRQADPQEGHEADRRPRPVGPAGGGDGGGGGDHRRVCARTGGHGE